MFTQVGSGAKYWLDILVYYLGAGLAVTGQMRDIGQKVLQSSLQAESSSRPRFFQILFLISFLEEAFIRNLIIILFISFTI
jgi:F0F1-type ATP synthase membrane subunit c/vacuolar-type H+-ATPase subunit K